MIALFGPIKADVLESDLPYLKLKPQRKLARSAQMITAKIGDRPFRLKVKPVDRHLDGSTWVEVLDDLQVRNDLRVSLVRSLELLEERRLAHRERAAFAVRSPDLPNFQAVTVDISETGVRLATAGPVAVGIKIRMEIDGREPAQRSRDVSGITIWSSRLAENDYQVGVRVLQRN